MPAPLATLAAQVTAAGISAPSYAEILSSLQTSFQSIYGTDAYLGADSQDGQLLAIFALAIHDTNQSCIAVYNSFAPSTAQGTHLSNLVKINGIARRVASNSQVNITVVGQAGATITAGKVRDDAGRLWALPAEVVIPPSGFIIATAVCEEPGAIAAPVGSITQIATPTLGWQSATNATIASLGASIESDAALRQRQAFSVALPANTTLMGLLGALQSLPGVTQVAVYENDTNATDSNGLPAHSIAVVVQGGDATAIAGTILRYKTPGAYTHGATEVEVHDDIGQLYLIRFFVPTEAAIKVEISLHAFAGYSTDVADLIKNSVASYVNGLPFGQDVLLSRLYLPALLSGAPESMLYQIVDLQIALLADPMGTADVPVAFNQQASLLASNVTLLVV